MKLKTFTKQPVEVKDYDIDYAEWLAPMGDSLDDVSTQVICTSTPADNSLVVDRVDMTDDRLKLWISGGTHGETYKISVDVETVGQRIDQSELIFKIKDV